MTTGGTVTGAPIPENEQARLQALHALNILDTPSDPVLDRIVDDAREVCHTPIGLVTLIDADRQWFKASRGLALQEIGRDVSFCAHAIAAPDEAFVVEDARTDPRFAENPLVVDGPRVRAYAGVPIRTAAGHALGTLCVIDPEPRSLTTSQLIALRVLSSEASSVIQFRPLLRELRELASEQQRAGEVFRAAELVLAAATNRTRLVVQALRTGDGDPSPSAALAQALRTALPNGVDLQLHGQLPDDLSAEVRQALLAAATDVVVALLDLGSRAISVRCDQLGDERAVTISTPDTAAGAIAPDTVAGARYRLAVVGGWAGVLDSRPPSVELLLPRGRPAPA